MQNDPADPAASLTFGACVKHIWSSAVQAIAQMPGLMLGAWIVFACLQLLFGSYRDNAADAAALAASTRIGHAFASLALSALQLVVYGIVTIKVHRFVLLGEHTHPLMPDGGKPLARYALTSIAFALTLIAAGLALVPGIRHFGRASILPAVLLITCVYFWAAVRVSLLFPSLSIGGRITPRIAWRDSAGHVWSMSWIGFVAVLPLVVVQLVFYVIVVGVRGLIDPQRNVPVTILSTAFSLAFIVLSAASMAWLYRRYANGLLAEAAHEASQ
jgi:hypothetical protein